MERIVLNVFIPELSPTMVMVRLSALIKSELYYHTVWECKYCGTSVEYDLCKISPLSVSHLTCVCWLDDGRRGILEGQALRLLETGAQAKTKGMGVAQPHTHAHTHIHTRMHTYMYMHTHSCNVHSGPVGTMLFTSPLCLMELPVW